jgi:anhydro-N-acetylmuramic acid kinase
VLLLGREPDRVRGSLNLGGISNVTVVGPGREPLAYDIGPANALTDAVVAVETGGRESWDEGGTRAARGKVDERLLTELLDEPYYELPPPKSTGKELFHLAYVREKVGGRSISTDDLLATLTALSAETVAADLLELGVADVVAAGGGTRNPTLMAELARRLPGVPIETFDVFGIPETAKEALVFAIIGILTVHRLPASVPSCTGAGHASILGAVVPGAAPLLPIEGAQAPDRLVVRTPLR